MLKHKILLVIFFISVGTFAQVVKDTQIKDKEIDINEIDSVAMDTILLEEVVISKVKLDPEAQKQFLLLQNRVYKVYPFARTASERLSMMNAI